MADYTSSSQGGGYSFEHDAGMAPQVAAKPLTKFANFAGAALSITLIVGIGVWGYKLLVRDVTGIPVVRAAQGDMRVRPENPGGQLADNQGLSVNAVASEGTANQFAEQLILAPKPLDLEEEDQPIPVAMVAPAQQAPTQSSPAADVAEALKNGDVDDLVASLTDGVEPLEDEEDGTALPEPMNASATMDVDPLEMAVSNAVAVAMGEEPGVRASLRPQTRPGGRAVATKASFEPAPVAAAEVKELSPDSLPTGTRLVQLGAFDSPQIARAQWVRLNARFGAYMEGKDRIIQEASSGGRTFYRLRAHGFSDIADARRFCSALVAENTDCIPVVTR
ncbi:MAG: SPOR domain-containing protein [Sulfitobacter pontiacus]|jgi:hypothetical protein|nr:SPOR domain-containing protein [Sulfitobacter sp. EE-36]